MRKRKIVKGKAKTKVKTAKIQPKKQKKKFTQGELDFPEDPSFLRH